MVLEFGAKTWFVFVISILLLTDLSILFNIPFVRQILGFLSLTLLPGLLIIQILKLNKIDFLEKFVLAWGLSISFLMFFGLLINNLSLSFGYETPLATVSLLILFNIAFVALGIIGFKTNKNPIFSFPNLNLSSSEKAFLVIPVIFPALSIFGMYLMNTTDNNTILMFLLFLIPTYVAFVCFFNHKFPKRLYPVVIFLISISLLLLLALRSNYIIGMDIYKEYYIFRTTLANQHWSAFTVGNALDACLSISILPTIYQSVLNISPEFLFKILYSLIYSITPLIIYILSKKYVEEGYAFLASCFFMSQSNFLFTAYNPRTNIAILFFALAMMTLFNGRIDPLKRRILFIIFTASCMMSHYSSTYIFFFILLVAFVGLEVLSKKYTFKKAVSLTIVILFFSMIFFWYSQVTETAFTSGVGFIENTLSNLNRFFVEESRGEVQGLLGEGIVQKRIPQKIEFVFSWLTSALIAVGVITLIIRHKDMSFPELNFKKPEFLKNKFEVEYFVIALACFGLLVAVVALPYLAVGYSIRRSHAQAIVILSVFFVIGGITVVKAISSNLLRKVLPKQTFRKSLTKNASQLRGKKLLLKKQKEWENDEQVWAYLIILLVLLPYFLCTTGVMYNIFGIPKAITLNSEGGQSDRLLTHDQSAHAAKWFGENYVKQKLYVVYVADWRGSRLLISQCILSLKQINTWSFQRHENINGYIYLRYYNVVNGLLGGGHNMTEYSDMFIGKNRIYDNGGSEVWR